MIEAKAINKNYPNGRDKLEVLKNISLEIKKNEFLAIQGPSGAGKSTLLHILGGLDIPSSGKVYFAGEDLYALSENSRSFIRNRKIGFVFQFFYLLPELSALENVLLPALVKSWWQRGKVKTYALELLEMMGLLQRLKHRPNELSGGEQQRVAICRALINRPEVLFCDEPTGNLDSENGRIVLDVIADLKNRTGLTVVLVTHDKDIASQAERIVYLRDGVVLS